MNDECEELKNLYNKVPTYNYGTVSELHTIYMKTRILILRIAARENDKIMQQTLGISSVEIETLIEHARRAKKKSDKEMYFKRASEQLEEDIKTAMGLIKCK